MGKKNPLIISDKQVALEKESWSKNKFYMDLVINKVNPAQEDNITRLSDVMSKLPCGVVFNVLCQTSLIFVELILSSQYVATAAFTLFTFKESEK